MAYQDPKVDWNEGYIPSPEDMNRIEVNTEQNHDDINTEESARIAGDNQILYGNNTFTGNNTFNEGVDLGNTGNRLKAKFFSGTLDSSGDVEFNHGLDWSKIYGMIALAYDGIDYRTVMIGSTIFFIARVNSTIVRLDGDYPTFGSRNYKVTLLYID